MARYFCEVCAASLNDLSEEFFVPQYDEGEFVGYVCIRCVEKNKRFRKFLEYLEKKYAIDL